jgi:GTPase SAR1 family protein
MNGDDFLDLDQGNNLDDLKSKIPLPEGVLKVNLGIPILIVCTKTDLINHGEKVQ